MRAVTLTTLRSRQRDSHVLTVVNTGERPGQTALALAYLIDGLPTIRRHPEQRPP